jgi:hypothetical protein
MTIASCLPASVRTALVLSAVLLLAVRRESAAGQPAIEGYADYRALSESVKKLATVVPADAPAAGPQVNVESLGRTLGGREIWLLKIARGKAEDKPAILIVGSVYAPHLVGSELAMRLAQLLAAGKKETGADALLERYSFYIIPRPNPDASEAFFVKPYVERAANERPTDDDRDGALDEDPTQDLNGDGWITQLRVEDASGVLTAHPNDPRVLIDVEAKNNEPGKYRLLSEGIDDDHDEAFNEDGPGGVSFNRNFTFRYPFFAAGAGPNQVSEVESRAVADFAFSHPNIAAVFCFTPEDNLFEPWKPGEDGARIKTSILSGDSGYFNYVAQQYRTIHGGKDAPSPAQGEGSFSQWAYFHFGRWSFAARGWWILKVAAKPDAAKSEADKPETEKNGGDKPAAAPEGEKPAEKPAGKLAAKPVDEKRGADDINALAWFQEKGIDGFVDWKEIAHPDFPDRKVEVGGFKPFLRLNPPADELDPLADKHLQFLVKLGELMPSIKLEHTKVDPLGGGVFRVTAEVVNHGYLPTMPAMGHTTGEQHPLQIEIVLPAGAKLITGHRRTQFDPLAGSGGRVERTWLVQAEKADARKIELKVWSPSVGSDAKTVELK